jgi:hydrogenase maturation protein HypF
MVAAPAEDRPVRTRARVQGTVQGVGFRPFVYRLALEEGLAGYVRNDEQGVLLEVQGSAVAVDRFMSRLRCETPPLAVIDQVLTDTVAPGGGAAFEILTSRHAGRPDALITPDTATCADCLAELHDPTDRRYRYPFINCTNCGPRLTIVLGVPYDRALTTMSPFAMCEDCRSEYEDPTDRRFHAQPNACARCGPRARLTDAAGRPLDLAGARDPVQAAAVRLAAGEIIALKGLGGFHLACDAADPLAVEALRARKHREDKPFALMVADPGAARRLVSLPAEEERLLGSVQRPIVLASRRQSAPVAAAVAPRAPELGVMLPYTPLHHLLLADFVAASGGSLALVMTSGNISDEPIAYRDQDARERLAAIADVFLIHDREIETRVDDSVVRAVSVGGRRRPLILRRSRGYVPSPLQLPVGARLALLACGAEQKSTFCLAKGSRAWVGHHVGDLEHYSTLRAYQDGIAHFERLFAIAPGVVAHDLHPDYLSTAYALGRDDVQLIGVQHHHAHLAAGLAEHGLRGPAVGAIFDGTGYGPDATVWGGELLVGGLEGFERAGSLHPVRMPGGAVAIRQPWRMAASWLAEGFGAPQPLPPHLAGQVSAGRWEAIAGIAASAAVSPLTTSMGRLFDAVGALCGLRADVTYEGQAAVELEAAAVRAPEQGAYPLAVVEGGGLAAGRLVLDPRETIRTLSRELEGGTAVPVVASRFHGAVTQATVAAVLRIAAERDLETVVLSGGVFQNRLLLEAVAAGLERRSLRVIFPERLPPNDGGISFGQAAVAAAALERDARG